jgi:hypothetical protein
MNEASASSKTSGAPTNFLSLPRELRNQIYAYVLVDQDYIALETWYYPRPPLFPRLLRTNKTIHGEATELLYTHNRFSFTMCHPELLPSFLDRIGPDNSKHIRHIRIDFPWLCDLYLGEVTLSDESIRTLEKLKSCCANLRTLTTSRSSTNIMELRLDTLDNPKVVTEALKLVDIRLRAISSLQERNSLTTASCQPSQLEFEPDSSCILATASSIPSPDHDSANPVLSIIIEVYDDGPSDDIRRKMESHGWTLSRAKNVEEENSDWSFSDFDYDDYYCWGGDDYDDYDIDNDSDFWRRAGD